MVKQKLTESFYFAELKFYGQLKVGEHTWQTPLNITVTLDRVACKVVPSLSETCCLPVGAGINRMRVVAVLLSLCLFVACTDAGESPAGVSVGDLLPDFTIRMDDGSVVGSADMRDTVSLVCFFNTGCGDCRAELPVIQALCDLAICRTVLISRAESEGSVRKYWDDNGFTMGFSAQDDDRVYRKFASGSIPRLYLADRHGYIRFMTDDSMLPTLEMLESEINRIKNGY